MALIKFETNIEAGKKITIDITEVNPPVITATNLSITETKKQLIMIFAEELIEKVIQIRKGYK